MTSTRAILPALMFAMFSVVLIAPSTSTACSCAPLPPVDQYMKSVDLAFWGKVVSRKVERFTIVAVVEPEKVYRGRPGDRVTVHSSQPCGMDLEVGQGYTLTLRKSGDGDYHVGSCGYSSKDMFPPAEVGSAGVRDLEPLKRRLERPLRADIDKALGDCETSEAVSWKSGSLLIYPGGLLEPTNIATSWAEEPQHEFRQCLTRALLVHVDVPDIGDHALQVRFTNRPKADTVLTFQDASRRPSPEDSIRAALLRKPKLIAESSARVEAQQHRTGVRKQEAAPEICEFDGYAKAREYFDGISHRLDAKVVFDIHRRLLDCALRHGDAVGAMVSATVLLDDRKFEDEVMLPTLEWATGVAPGEPLTADGREFPGEAVDRRMLINWAGRSTKWVDAPILLEAVAHALTTAPDGSQRQSADAALAWRRAGLLQPLSADRYRALARAAWPDIDDDPALHEMKAHFEKARSNEAEIERLSALELAALADADPAESSLDDAEGAPGSIIEAPTAASAAPPVDESADEEDDEMSPWWIAVGLVVVGYLISAFRRGLRRPA